MEKHNQLCDKYDFLNTHPISKKFMARFIQEASYEDDPSIQDMWAALLHSEIKQESHSHFIHSLKELDRNSVELLLCIHRATFKQNNPENEILILNQKAFGFANTPIDIQEHQKSGVAYPIPHTDIHNNTQLTSALLLSKLNLISLQTLLTTKESAKSATNHSLWAKISPYGSTFLEVCLTSNHKEPHHDIN
tara:strand:+ start:1006 stop:1581 length:576 start_codon:yes stop_codon:yes gene_type:complete